MSETGPHVRRCMKCLEMFQTPSKDRRHCYRCRHGAYYGTATIPPHLDRLHEEPTPELLYFRAFWSAVRREIRA